MPGKSSVVFGKSWCATSVSGSQVFGQALMESCEVGSFKSNPKSHLQVVDQCKEVKTSQVANNLCKWFDSNLSTVACKQFENSLQVGSVAI